MDATEQFLDHVADSDSKIKELNERLGPAYGQRILVLLNDTAERVPAVWAEGGCPLVVTAESLWAVPLAKHGPEWSAMASALIACAKRQAWLETVAVEYYAAMWKHAEKHTRRALRLGKSQIRSVSRIGPGKKRYDRKVAERSERNAKNKQRETTEGPE